MGGEPRRTPGSRVKVLVDTSVWVDFFNGHESPEAGKLADLIRRVENIVVCRVVLAQFFQGIRRRENVEELESYFRDMPCLAPMEPDTYLSAAALFRDLRARGVTIRSTIDCVIARLAEENSALLLAKDQDMRLIVESGLCRIRAVQ